MATDGERVRLIGGEWDGHTMPIPKIEEWVVMPSRPPVSVAEGSSMDRLATLTYRLALDDTGHPSRDDDGVILYRLEP